MTVSELNTLDSKRFVDAIGWVCEHSPWVAERAWYSRPFESLDHLYSQMVRELRRATRAEQLALLNAHPDLGTRAAISMASTSEQSGAGLHQLTADELNRLNGLNDSYRNKFGFPFLFAVKGSDKFVILENLERRLSSTPQEEFREALRQAGRIVRFRLESIIE